MEYKFHIISNLSFSREVNCLCDDGRWGIGCPGAFKLEKMRKTRWKDLADARQLNLDSHYGMMEAMGHSSGPSLAKDMVESGPNPYVAEQVQMHRENQEAAQKEIDRCHHDLGRLRAREKSLQQKIQQLEQVVGPKAPRPDGGAGGGGGGGGGSC